MFLCGLVHHELVSVKLQILYIEMIHSFGLQKTEKFLFFNLWGKALECPSLPVAVWPVPAETSACCDPGRTSLHVGIPDNICYWGASQHQSTLPGGHKHKGNFKEKSSSN